MTRRRRGKRKKEKAALTNEDGNGDAGDPMDWDP
jgi:hypothetical protein